MPPTFPADLIARLRQARHVTVLTGAGISSESGVPTFRETLTGLWERFDPMTLATPQAFHRDPELVWGWYEWRRQLVMRCQPNAAHLALVALQARVPRVDVLTQNVDDLHERAGQRGVIHLHGSLFAPRCDRCRRPYTLPPGIPDEPEGGRHLAPPACTFCGGSVRPGVVWFGENLPGDAWVQAQDSAAACDLFLSIGTSSLVHPAAELPGMAQAGGACVVQVNLQPTALEPAPDHDLRASAADILPALLQAAWPDAS